jgi:hypothetical protein
VLTRLFEVFPGVQVLDIRFFDHGEYALVRIQILLTFLTLRAIILVWTLHPSGT